MRLNDTAVLVIILSCWLQKSLFSLLLHLPPDFCPSGLNTLTDGFVSCFQHKHVCVSHKGTREESTSFPTNDSIPTSVGMSSSWLSQGVTSPEHTVSKVQHVFILSMTHAEIKMQFSILNVHNFTTLVKKKRSNNILLPSTSLKKTNAGFSD